MSPTRKLIVAVSLVALGFFAVGLSIGRGAGSNAVEEAAIRKIIAAALTASTMPQLPDHIFWSGPIKRPTVGDEKAEPKDYPNAIGNRVPGSQKARIEPIRIVVADSRDLAYEYSKGTVEFDLKAGGHVRADTGVLRVWQKQGGEWKVAASFARPYDQ